MKPIIEACYLFFWSHFRY